MVVVFEVVLLYLCSLVVDWLGVGYCCLDWWV